MVTRLGDWQVVYSDFLTLVRGGAVRSARIDEDNALVYFELSRTPAVPEPAPGADPVAVRPLLAAA